MIPVVEPTAGASIVVAPPGWRSIDFISDLHLAPALPRTFQAWSSYMAGTSADAVFVLGDLFDAWLGDDTAQGPFESDCLAVLRAAARQRPVAFMAGNRDFLLGSDLLHALGVARLDDPTALHAFGRVVLLSHGDALCLADTEYQAFRRIVRTEDWQRHFVGLPIGERARLVDEIRQRGESRRGGAFDPADWADVDPQAARDWMHRAAASLLVHGHTHRPGRSALAPGVEREVLSDWELDSALPRAEVLRFDASGFKRLDPERAVAAAG